MNSLDTWTLDPIFGDHGGKWTSPAHEDWTIYQQPAGFYVWHHWMLAGETPSLEAAVARVETRRAEGGF